MLTNNKDCVSVKTIIFFSSEFTESLNKQLAVTIYCSCFLIILLIVLFFPRRLIINEYLIS